MDKRIFSSLLQFLKDRGGLTDSLRICAGEKLMIYIHVLKGGTNRETNERWQHSSATISKIIHEVSICFETVQDLLFIKPSLNVPAKVANDPKCVRCRQF